MKETTKKIKEVESYFEKLSQSAKEIIESGVGYRNDGLSTGTYTIEEVIKFETEELGNDDIFETCKNLHGTRLVHNVIKDYFESKTDKKVKKYLYGLWLGRKKDIEDYYSFEGEVSLSTYKLPENFLVVSDLHEEGVLFVFDKHPDFLFLEEETLTLKY